MNRAKQMTDLISLEGPVELVNGELMIRIPLAASGDKWAPLAVGTGVIDPPSGR
jgi:hypothetical protein